MVPTRDHGLLSSAARWTRSGRFGSMWEKDGTRMRPPFSVVAILAFFVHRFLPSKIGSAMGLAKLG
jgi:hypothetical protein